MAQLDSHMDKRGARVFERETDYRYGRFAAWCPMLARCSVGLYGSGANARRILEDDSLPFEVRAVVDDGVVGSDICDMRVMGLDEAPANGIDTLVIAAEFNSAVAVIQRIEPFCRMHGLRVFDMYGNDLLEITDEMRVILRQSLEDQMRAIESAGTLCVDLEIFRKERLGNTTVECLRGAGRIGQCLDSVIEFAIAQGKGIVFYSGDIELSSDAAHALLLSKGLEGVGDLILSSEHALFVENGLYRKLYERVSLEDVVHIGADSFRDCFIPLSYGSKAVLARSLELTDYSWFNQGVGASMTRGEWFEQEPSGLDPADERLCSCASEILPDVCAGMEDGVAKAVFAIAPLVVAYTTWLVFRLGQEHGAYPAVLFSARDGYLPKAVYDAYREQRDDSLPPSLYFYTSRKSSAAASDPGELGALQRANAMRHYASSGLALGRTYAFVEFVGAGTCQQQLERFTPFALHGFYFGSRVGDCLESLVDSECYFDEDDLGFLMRYLKLEPYLSSDEPSLEGFDGSGSPVFAPELRPASELVVLQAVQERVVRFAREYFARWHQQGDVIDHAYVNAIVPALDECDEDGLSLYDDASGRKLTKRIDDFPSPAVEPEFPTCDEGVRENEGVRTDLLAILQAFDTVCGEFGLTYVATHGTMLGAVRDGGLIAGDTDLDVAMPRPDYDKLLSLAEAGVFPDPLFLQTPENDSSSFSGGFAKLWKLRGEDDSGEAGGSRTLEGCAWMDIMPLDNCPRDDVAVERRQRVIRSLQRTLYIQSYGFDLSKIYDANPKRLSAYFILADHMSRARLCELLKRACSSHTHTGLYTIFAGNYRWQRNRVRFTADAIEHAIRIPFEDTSMPVPQNAEQWLEGHYGSGWREDSSQDGASAEQ